MPIFVGTGSLCGSGGTKTLCLCLWNQGIVPISVGTWVGSLCGECKVGVFLDVVGGYPATSMFQHVQIQLTHTDTFVCTLFVQELHIHILLGITRHPVVVDEAPPTLCVHMYIHSWWKWTWCEGCFDQKEMHVWVLDPSVAWAAPCSV